MSNADRKIYADLTFYKTVFLAGDTQLIPDDSFIRRARQASAYIDQGTFGRLANVENIPIDVKHCTCELAEAYYTNATASSTTQKRSESIGSYSVSYADQARKQEEFNANLWAILSRWLANTGLMES